MEKFELLAPAGDIESFYAAISNGANAVYLGLSDFNARIKANNFTIDVLKNALYYAHIRNVKIYVTVNTMIKDNEYDSLLELVKQAYEAGVDGFLVQDLGLANVMRKTFPDIILHASTQMGIHNLDGAIEAEKMGFKRIVLARETKLEDIKLIKEKTHLELEYFVQGALCVSFSGNCYFSAFKTGMSGNRGRCQQLCRLKYSAFNDQEFIKSGFLLSPRDLALIKQLQDLKDCGINSLKIEGRLRRPGYVAEAVNAYRHAIDYLEKGIKTDIKEDILNLRKAFSRGDFNYQAYLENGTPNNVINADVQNHQGIQIGKTISCKNFKDIYAIEIYSNQQISKGDGLKFFINGIECGSVGVGNVDELGNNTYRIYSKNKVKNGALIFLTLDSNSEQALLAAKTKVGINANVYAEVNAPLVISFNFENYTGSATSDYIIPEATTTPTSDEEIKTQVSKLNSDDFYLKKVHIQSNNGFLPKSVINETRRIALESLIENIHINIVDSKRIGKITEINQYKERAPFSYSKRLLYVNEKTYLNNVLNDRMQDNYCVIIAPMEIKAASEIYANIKSLYPNIDIGLNLPIIVNGQDNKLIEEVISTLDSNIILVVNNIGGLKYMKDHRVIIGLGMNVLSNIDIAYFANQKVLNIILSVEASKKLIEDNIDCYYYSFGYNTLMNFAHCPYKTVNGNRCSHCSYTGNLNYKDESNQYYKIRRIHLNQCYFELLNDKYINVFGAHNALVAADARNLDESEEKNLKSILFNDEPQNVTIVDYQGLLKKEIK